MIQGHGGNIRTAALQLGCRPEDIMDMSSNINPLGMMPGLNEHLADRLQSIMSLPEVDAGGAVAAISSLLGIDNRRVLMGTGTTQFIYTVCPALGVEKALIVGPTYADYESSCRMYGVETAFFIAEAGEDFTVDVGRLAQKAKDVDVVFLCNSNNPTGHLVQHEMLVDLCRQLPGTVFVIDESYLPFASEGVDQSMSTTELENVIVLWSISKIFGIPGLRAGFLVANSNHLEKFRRFMQPWCANSLAQEAVKFMADNQETVEQFIKETKLYLQIEMTLFQERLQTSPISLYSTHAPYQLLGLPDGYSSALVWEKMLEKRILIRDCSNFHGLSNRFIRIALKKPEVNKVAVESLAEIVGR